MRYAVSMERKVAGMLSGLMLLAPASVLADTATTSVGMVPLPEYASSGSFTVRFSLGDKVQVADGPLRARSRPSLTSSITGVQPLSARGVVRDGAVQQDGYVWWFVDYDSGPDGWSAEEFFAPIVVSDSVAAQVAALQAALRSILERIRELQQAQ